MISDALARVSDLLERETGVVIGTAQHGSLAAAIARMAPGMTAGRLLAGGCTGDTLERLIDEVTVRETYFFRHRTELDTIDWHEALRAAHAHGTDALRVWIAGCASGEEAYTIAILACEAFGTATPPVRILATDIAPTGLAQARSGCYGTRAARTLDETVLRRYFSTENRTLRVNRSLRALVEVRRHNLARDSFPPAGSPRLDLILCRNVLIYFERSTVDRVLKSLEGALWPGGRLILGAADRISGQPRRSTAPLPLRATARHSQFPVLPEATRGRPAPHPASAVRAASVASGAPAAGGSTAAANIDARRERLSGALRAGDRGDLEVALQIAGDAVAADPLDAEAYFVIGLAELAREHPRAAIGSLRRALYIDPTSGLAAFNLARAYESLGTLGPARRAYRQALRTLELEIRERPVAEARDLAEVTSACEARLQALVTQP
jgi:chemotaxis protein methyltransferase CheR